MGRIIYLMLMILAFNLAMFLFSCSDWDTDGTCITGSSNNSGTIWDYAKNPESFTGDTSSTSFWKTIFGVNGLLMVGGGIVVTVAALFANELLIFIGLGIALLPQLNILIKFYQQISNSAFFEGREILGVVMAIILMMPLILAWIFMLIDWMRGRE